MRYLYLLPLAVLLATSCRRAGNPVPAENGPYVMPAVPSSLTDSTDRANYAVTHYWDDFPFATATDSLYVEQAFVNFLAVAPLATAPVRAAAIDSLLRRVPTSDLSNTFVNLADHYLGNPSSPMYNDSLYLDFLQAFVALPSVDDGAKTRPRFLIRSLMKNAVGTEAADFIYYDTRDRRRHTLHDMQAPYLVVCFNDPTCESCQETLPVAFAMASLRQPDVRVILVNTEQEQGVGSINGQPLPPNWTDAYDPAQTITRKQLYYLPALPAIYLLDGHHRVLLKNVSLQDLDTYLDTLATPSP